MEGKQWHQIAKWLAQSSTKIPVADLGTESQSPDSHSVGAPWLSNANLPIHFIITVFLIIQT